jgi:hypothetical protein
MTGGLDPEEDDAPLAEAAETRAPAAKSAPAETPTDARVLALLVAERRPWTPGEISARTAIPVRNVQRALGKLVGDRHAKRAGGGKFALARRRPR